MNARNRTRGRSNSRSPRNNGRPNPQNKKRAKKGLFGRLAAWLKSLFGSKEPQVPISSSRLYVGNLPYKTGHKDLMDIFSQYGTVVSAEVIFDRGSNRSKGFGFVEMEGIDQARVAAEKLHNRDFEGRKLIVSGAKAEGKESDRRSSQREFSSDAA